MKRFLGLAIGLFAVIGFTSSAEAININVAEVQNGVAVVHGNKAAKSAIITWEGQPVTSANPVGAFSFDGTVPENCVGTLSDGVSTIEVVVLDCMPGSNKIVNGRFETGDLTGWETIGDVSTQTASFGVRPSQGTFQVLITNAPDPLQEMIPSFSGTDAVSEGLITLFDASISEEPTFFTDLVQAGPFAQSGIKQSFTAKKPGVLTFDFSLPRGEYGIDIPVFVLDDTVLSLIPSQFLPWIGPSTPLSDPGYRRVVVSIEAGTHTFGFGIGSHLDTRFVSGLLVDNIVFRQGGPGTN
jgi:hypothetical protein